MQGDDPTDLDAELEARRSADAQLRLAAQVESEDWQWLMDQKQGRRIVWRLLERAAVYQPTFDSDAMAMAFKEGRRSLGVELLASARVLGGIDNAHRMERENLNRKTK